VAGSHPGGLARDDEQSDDRGTGTASGARPFAYYETVGGGAGAGAGKPGASGIQVHMTNTLNTPIEALELAYPLRVTRTTIARGSGGRGRARGGDGIEREIEVLVPARVAVLSERRVRGAPGAAGGAAGRPGANWIVRRGAGRDGREVRGRPRGARSRRTADAGRRRPRPRLATKGRELMRSVALALVVALAGCTSIDVLLQDGDVRGDAARSRASTSARRS
jgi:N-methylhydantoinase B/oxoprolinase/acetone carboxylase alpha subunit